MSPCYGNRAIVGPHGFSELADRVRDSRFLLVIRPPLLNSACLSNRIGDFATIEICNVEVRRALPMISAGARPSCSHIRLSVLLIFLILALQRAQAQSASPTSGPPNETWAGRRIVTLQGFGDYSISGQHGQSELIRPDGLGVNIVTVVQQVEREHIWIKANGAGDAPVGWVNKKNAILLDDAIPYFTSLIDRNPNDWDAYLRRAESEYGLNRREPAITDYTREIELHPDEPFLFLRRG